MRRPSFDLLRAELDYAGEHEERSAQGSPIWVDFRTWSAAYSASQRPAKLAADDDLQQRLRRCKVESAELDLQERRDRLADRRGQYIPKAEMDGAIRFILASIESFANLQLDDEQKLQFIEALADATQRFKEWRQRQPEAHDVDGDAVVGVRPGGRDRHAETERNKRPARAAAESTGGK